MNRVVNTPPRAGRRAVLSIALVLSMLFFFVSCDAAKIYLPPVPPVIEPDGQDIASNLPEAEIARIGLLDPEDVPENTSVSRRFVSSSASGASVMRFTAKAAGEESMISEVTLSGYVYNGYVYTTSTPVTVTYPAISTDTTNEYSLEEFTINASNVAVTKVGSSAETKVSISGSLGYLPKDDTAPASNTTITVSGTTVSSVSNIPASEDITMDPYEGSYEIDGSEISKEESVGMDGSADAPYTISRLSDLLRLDSLFASSRNVNIRLENNLTITAEWVVANGMTDPVTVDAGQNVTIDFNGNTITYEVAGSARPFRVEAGGALTFNNGKSNSIEEGAGGVTITPEDALGLADNYGTMIINGGSYDIQTKQGTCAIRSFEDADITINNARFYFPYSGGTLLSYGNATIEDGYFFSNSNSQLYKDSWTYNIRNLGNMTINGGEVYGIQGGIAAIAGLLTINDVYSETDDREVEGKMTNASFYALYVSGDSSDASCVVKGGTFVSNNNPSLWIGNSNSGGDGGVMANAYCTVNNGTFRNETGDSDVQVDYDLGNLYLHGGHFDHEKVTVRKSGATSTPSVLSAYVADGYHVEAVSDGYQIVAD